MRHRPTSRNRINKPEHILHAKGASGSVATGEPREVFRDHPESASDVAFSPDGRTLASVGTNQSVAFRHLATGKELLTIPMRDAGSFLAFSPDGRRLAVTLEHEEVNYQTGLRFFTAPAPAAP